MMVIQTRRVLGESGSFSGISWGGSSCEQYRNADSTSILEYRQSGRWKNSFKPSMSLKQMRCTLWAMEALDGLLEESQWVSQDIELDFDKTLAVLTV